MKLREYALIAEIVSGVAIVVTLIFLIVEVNANTNATLAANRQSLASRTEALLLAQSTSPDIARLVTKARNDEEFTEEERYQFAGHVAGYLRLAEEAYLQFLDGHLDGEYWRTRAENLVDSRLSNQPARELWIEWEQKGWFTPEFTGWLNNELEEKYGPQMRP